MANGVALQAEPIAACLSIERDCRLYAQRKCACEQYRSFYECILHHYSECIENRMENFWHVNLLVTL